MKKISKILLLVFTLLFTFSNNVFAAETNANNNAIQGTENVRIISSDEYYNLIAKARNISIQQAKLMTDRIIAQHEAKLKESNVSKGGISTLSIGWGSSWSGSGGTYYNAVVYKQQDVGGGMIIEVGVPSVIYIAGSYARQFVSIDQAACYAKPISSGTYTYDPFTKTASLQNNQVHLNSRGNVEITTSIATSLGFSVKDLLSFGFTATNNTTYRRTVTISHVESLY